MYKLPRLIKFSIGIIIGCAILIFGFGYTNISKAKTNASDKAVHSKTTHKNTNHKNTSHKEDLANNQTKTADKAEPVNWLMPSGGAYPEIGPNDPIWIKVSKEQQKVYIMNGNNVIYTMVCSTGLDTSPDTSTPEGTFYIQKERGTSFYNPNEQEGAKYWVSWKNHGEFLFHSVATDKNGNIIQSEAIKLGQKASHGCIRLTVPDAKWIYDNIQYNTKVEIS